MRPEAARLALEGHFNEAWSVKGPVRSTATSEIFMGECRLFDYPLAIKRYKAASNAHAIQHEALRELEAVWPGPRELRVPRIVGCLNEERLLVMEWVRGRSLKELATYRFAPPAKAFRGCLQAGEWLAHLHAIHPAGSRCIDVDGVLSFTRERVSADLAMSRTARLALEALAASAQAAGRVEMRASRLHGDFKPDNIIMGDAGVTGIDVSFVGTNVVAFDLIQFINHMEIYTGRRGRLLSLAFLSGYRQVPPELPFLWLRLFGILKLWSATMSGGKAIAHPIQCLRFARLASELTGDLMRLVSAGETAPRLEATAS